MAQKQSAAINRKEESKYYEDFEPLRATPEAVARKIVLTPPKKVGEWKYMKKLASRKSS